MSDATPVRLPAPFDRLLADVPDVAAVYDEHVDDYGEVIPHVLMADVARLFNDRLVASTGTGPEAGDATAFVTAVLASLEASLAADSASAEEVVSASFLENLEQEDEAYDKARGLMGPRLLGMLDRIEQG
jgi:hypothetical protein